MKLPKVVTPRAPRRTAKAALPSIGHLIDGALVDGGSRSQDVFNPATGQAEKTVQLADKLTVEQAIAAAQAAYPAWRATPPTALPSAIHKYSAKLCVMGLRCLCKFDLVGFILCPRA